MLKEIGILRNFLMVNSINMVGKWICYYLSLNCPIPGCKFGGFTKHYFLYNDSLKQGILTNNSRYDPVMTPKWDWPAWFMFQDRKKEYEYSSTLGTRISHIFRSYGNYFW